MAVYNNVVIKDERWTAFDGDVFYDTAISNQYSELIVSSGGEAIQTHVDNLGKINVKGHGFVEYVTIDGCNAYYAEDTRLTVDANGSANHVEVINGGAVYMYEGARVTNLHIDGTGALYVAVTSDTILTGTSNGKEILVKDGVMSNITLSGTGVRGYGMAVGDQWIAYDTLVKHHYSTQLITSGGRAIRTKAVNDGTIDVKALGYVESAVVDGAVMRVSNNASAHNVNVSNGATLYLYAGGRVTDLNVDHSGILFVDVTSDTVVTGTSNGKKIQVKDGVMSNITLSGNGVRGYGMAVGDQWTAYDTLVKHHYCTQLITSGGRAIRTKAVNDGTIDVKALGYVESAVVDGAVMRVSNNASAHNVNVSNGATLYLYAGGRVTDLNVDHSGILFVEVTSDTVVTGTSEGKKIQVKDGVISNITLSGNGVRGYGMTVEDQWAAYDTLVKHHYCTQLITSGGRAIRTKVTGGGDVEVRNGGLAQSTTIADDNSNMRVQAGGTASDIKVDLGKLTVYKGGKITGEMKFSKNGKVVASAGSIVDFDISNRSASKGFLLSDYSVISGAPNFTITVADMQRGGEYKLADYAEDFNSVITVGNGEYDFGTLQVGGSTLTYNDINYTLVKDNGDLILKVVSPYTPPAAPSVSADITAITNRDVTVTAVFAHDSVKNEYSINGGAWKTYTNGIVFTDNGSVSFRSSSNKGVYSDITSYTVTNIDKIAPDKPVISPSTSELTNGTVTVSASFSSDSLSREYSLDNKVWQSYNSGVVMSDNGTVYFRGCDEAGNYSQIAFYTVSNIDRTAPVKPTAYADITTPTKGNVSVFATFAQDSAKNEYSTDNSKWNIYENGVEMTQNGTVYFRSTDAAGNISSVTEFVVGNIDRTAPGKPVVSADTTAVTNKDVVLTAVFDDDAVKNEYSFDGKNWQNCTGKVVCPQNGKVYFRSTDAAGNVSGVTGFDVANIDKTAPEQPQLSADVTTLTNKDVTITAIFSEDSVLQEYSFDNQNWFTYTGGVNAAANGKVYFRGVDEAGNASAETFYEVTNIDKTAPEAPLATADITDVTRLNVTVTATFAADSVLDQYSVNGGAWTTYSGGVLVTANGKITFRSTDEAGNISETVYTVSNIDRIAPNLPEVKLSTTVLTNKDVTVTATFAADSVLNEYSVNGGEWQIYDGGIVFSENGEIAFRSTDEAGNVSGKRVYKVSNINKDLPEVPENSEYCFVKKSYNNKITGKKQDGIKLQWGKNAVNSLDDVPEGMIAVLLDSKNTLTAIPDGIETIAGKAEILTINKTDYKANFSAAGTLNLNSIDTGDVEFIRFATVNVTDGAVVGDIAGGKENISETVKASLKNGIATKTVTYKQTVTASGKVTVTDATAGDISGYSTVTLDNGVAGEVVNSNVKISKSDKTVGGKDDTITHTTTYSASGTATLKNGSYVDSIGGFKTVKLTASTVGEIVLGDSYTEKFTLKKGVKTPSSKKTYTGTVTLENASVGNIVGMNKVTASKGFNTLESYTGSAGNDTLTINKNAVLALGAVDMGAGAKDKFVNNGTLVLTGDFDRSFISGKGEIVAASDVYETLENKNGVLDLGATAEGFRSTKHENSDDILKKAVKWDLKSGDYTGWLGSWNGGSDNVDFIKFTIGKNDVDKELCVSGVENFTLYDKKGNEVDIISAAGTYTLKLDWDGTESTSYTLALA